MLLFECSICGVKLRKNRVVHHLFKCCSNGPEEANEAISSSPLLSSSAAQFSCVSCTLQLTGSDYLTHNCFAKSKSIVTDTSASRVSTTGIDTDGNCRSMTTDERMRNAWIETLRMTVLASCLTPSVKKALKTMNIYQAPRKFSKFLNYVRNVEGSNGDLSPESDILSVFEAAQKHFKQQFSDLSTNEATINHKSGKNKRKQKLNDDEKLGKKKLVI